MTSSETGPHWQRKVIAVAACRFSEAVAIGMLIPTLPIFIARLDAPSFPEHTAEELTAILFSATGFSMAAIQLLSMRVSDLLDRRKIFIMGGLGGAAICGFSYCLLETYTQLFL